MRQKDPDTNNTRRNNMPTRQTRRPVLRGTHRDMHPVRRHTQARSHPEIHVHTRQTPTPPAVPCSLLPLSPYDACLDQISVREREKSPELPQSWETRAKQNPEPSQAPSAQRRRQVLKFQRIHQTIPTLFPEARVRLVLEHHPSMTLSPASQTPSVSPAVKGRAEGAPSSHSPGSFPSELLSTPTPVSLSLSARLSPTSVHSKTNPHLHWIHHTQEPRNATP